LTSSLRQPRIQPLNSLGKAGTEPMVSQLRFVPAFLLRDEVRV
jgi:hypothetical protein